MQLLSSLLCIYIILVTMCAGHSSDMIVVQMSFGCPCDNMNGADQCTLHLRNIVYTHILHVCGM